MKDILQRKSEYLWEIPQSTREDMKVPAWIYCSENLLGLVFRDRSLQQLMNVTTLPGVQTRAVVMPDVHEGYGFPIGAVAATDLNDGVIPPGGIGYDINCGIRLLKTKFTHDEIRDKIKDLSQEINRQVPSGVGKGGSIKLNQNDMDDVLNNGCRWAVKQGFAEESDLKFIESFGSLDSADTKAVSQRAKERGRNQLGTMGAGNHFVEVDVIDKILDEDTAKVFGLSKGQIVIQIHTGSRGLGHQVATDHIKNMVTSLKSFGYDLPDRELACAPISSPIGMEYFAAMSAAANYAWTNRQLITHQIRTAWRNVFGESGGFVSLLYDVAHNIAKIEEHTIGNEKKKVMVHRKGSTRAFPAGHPEVTPEYRNVGQPVLIPGSMGTASYVLVGQPKNMEQSFGSTCHGSGRTMSRTAARKKIFGKDLFNQLTARGISVQTGSMKGLAEEAPDAYKDVESVVDVVHNAGIATKVARLKPLAVVKG
jgi:tRNA-splicing ligase RtcB (3'-phosphate/5'-hydroxy nucleic acid ligase)